MKPISTETAQPIELKVFIGFSLVGGVFLSVSGNPEKLFAPFFNKIRENIFEIRIEQVRNTLRQSPLCY